MRFTFNETEKEYDVFFSAGPLRLHARGKMGRYTYAMHIITLLHVDGALKLEIEAHKERGEVGRALGGGCIDFDEERVILTIGWDVEVHDVRLRCEEYERTENGLIFIDAAGQRWEMTEGPLIPHPMRFVQGNLRIAGDLNPVVLLREWDDTRPNAREWKLLPEE